MLVTEYCRKVFMNTESWAFNMFSLLKSNHVSVWLEGISKIIAFHLAENLQLKWEKNNKIKIFPEKLVTKMQE